MKPVEPLSFHVVIDTLVIEFSETDYLKCKLEFIMLADEMSGFASENQAARLLPNCSGKWA